MSWTDSAAKCHFFACTISTFRKSFDACSSITNNDHGMGNKARGWPNLVLRSHMPGMRAARLLLAESIKKLSFLRVKISSFVSQQQVASNFRPIQCKMHHVVYYQYSCADCLFFVAFTRENTNAILMQQMGPTLSARLNPVQRVEENSPCASSHRQLTARSMYWYADDCSQAVHCVDRNEKVVVQTEIRHFFFELSYLPWNQTAIYWQDISSMFTAATLELSYYIQSSCYYSCVRDV
jgi:hypothetical protein